MNSPFPFMGAPQQGSLLGAASGYGYPLTSGLLGALNQPHDYTQDALQLAGNPHAGPYANAPGLTAGSPVSTGSSGSSAGSAAGGLLTALAKNPALLKDGYNAVSGLLGDGLSSFGSQAAAGTASELGSAAAPAIAADTASALAPAVGSGATAAELGTTADALTPIATSDAAGSATAAGTAGSAAGSGSGLLGAIGAVAPIAAWFAAYENTNPVNESAAWWNDMTNRLNSSDPSVANLARLTTANDYLNGGGDMPYSQQQLASFGITPQYLANISRPITTPSPGGNGWLGGGFTGASRA